MPAESKSRALEDRYSYRKIEKVVAPGIQNPYLAQKFFQRDVFDARICDVIQTV